MTVLSITNLLTGIISLIPLGLDLAQKVKAAIEVDPNYQVSIKYLTDDATAANDEAIADIEAADPAAAPSSGVTDPPAPAPVDPVDPPAPTQAASSPATPSTPDNPS